MEERQPAVAPEIDLHHLFNIFRKLLQQVIGLVKYYFRTLFCNLLLLIFVAVLVSTIIAYATYFFARPQYKTEAMLMSRILPGKFCGELIGNLNALQNTRNFEALADQLQISLVAAGTIKSLEMTNFEDTLLLAGKDTAATIFSLSLRTDNNLFIDSIQKGVVRYLDNNPYSLNIKESRLRYLEKLQTSLEEKRKSLDSLKTIVNNSIAPRGQGHGFVYGEPVDPTKVYALELACLKDQLEAEEEIKRVNSIEVIQPFFTLTNTNYPNYLRILLHALLWGVIATLIITPILGRKPKKDHQ